MTSKNTTSKPKSITRRAAVDKKPAKTASTRKSSAKHPRPVKASVAPAPSQRNSKQAQLIAKLREPSGATIQKMMALTGWQAHTVRGTISGVLRKKLGLNVICETSSKSGERIYRIATSAASA